MTALQLETATRDEVTIVSMSGDLEVQEIEEFKQCLDGIVKQGTAPKAVLDVSEVTRMTSYVVALIGFYNAQFAQAKGRFVVSGATSPAQRALELSGLTLVLTTADTVDGALQLLKG